MRPTRNISHIIKDEEANLYQRFDEEKNICCLPTKFDEREGSHTWKYKFSFKGLSRRHNGSRQYKTTYKPGFNRIVPSLKCLGPTVIEGFLMSFWQGYSLRSYSLSTISSQYSFGTWMLRFARLDFQLRKPPRSESRIPLRFILMSEELEVVFAGKKFQSRLDHVWAIPQNWVIEFGRGTVSLH